MRAIPAGQMTEAVGAYVTEKTGATFAPGTFAAFSILSDTDEFVGGVVVSNYRTVDCELSCVAEHPAVWRPSVIRAVFTYVFDQLQCVRCTSITTKRNKRARQFLEGLGFRLEGSIRLGYDGRRDALIYGLLASECRYLSAEGLADHGEEIDTSGTGGTRSGGDGERSSGGEHVGGGIAG